MRRMNALRSPLLLLSVLALKGSAQVAFDDYVGYPLGARAEVVAVGDVDDDGALEVIVATSDSNDPGLAYSILVLQVDNAGGLSSPAVYPYAAPGFFEAKAIHTGDLNADGLVDVAIAIADSVGVFYQNAGHTLDPVQKTFSGEYVDGLALGDLNNDGIADLAASHSDDNYVRVFHGSALGFTTAIYPHPNAGNNHISIADMNADGLNDVLLKPAFFTHTLQAFYQDGLGALGLATAVSSSFGQSMNGMAIGDLNGDGLNDVAITTGGNIPNTFLRSLYQDQVTHDLFTSVSIAVSDQPEQVVIADLDCDGINEVIVLHGASTMRCHVQDSMGQLVNSFFKTVPYDPSRQQTSIAVADLDQDGREDLVVTGNAGGVAVLRNRSLSDPLDSLHLFIDVDTTYTDTVQDGWSFEIVVEDTVPPWLLHTEQVYGVDALIREDSVSWDSTLVRFATMCGQLVIDTLFLHHDELFVDTILTDTTLLYSWTDTLTLVVGDVLSDHAGFELGPNPTTGPVRILGPSVGRLNALGFEVITPAGTCVGSGVLSSPPWRIDLSDLPVGAYVIRLFAPDAVSFVRVLVAR